MDIGLALPHYDHSVPGERPLRWETVLRWAAAAEDAGLGSVWISDHLFVSLARWGVPRLDGEGGGTEGFEALTTLAALARATARVRLGTLVLCPHLRPPGALAKGLATVDVLSGGRLTVGLGAGWFEPEYAAAGLPFPPAGARVARMAETLEVLRLAFAGEPFDYRGEHVRVEGMVCRPRPRQRPGPPLWVGGLGDRVLGVAARGADGWNAGGWVGTVDGHRARAAVLDRACEEAGRDPGEVARSVNRLCLVGEDERDLGRRFEALAAVSPPGALRGMSLEDYREGRLVGTVEQVADQLDEWAEAGVSTLVVTLGALPFTVTGVDDLALVASASRPR